MTDRIRIGIVGGGLAGLTLAIAFIKHSHLEVHVYESATQFTERGAGIGLSPLALEALDDIIPSAVELLKTEAGAVDADAARLVVGSGSDTGAIVADLGVSSGLTMNRAGLLKALLSQLPNEILHAEKRVKLLEQSSSGVTLAFEDNTNAHFDAVIGADGIFSAVRNHVLGADWQEHSASPGGFWDCRHLVPFEKARAILGDDPFQVDRQYAWLGQEASMLHGIVENRTMVQCIIAVIDNNFSSDRKRPVTRQVLENALPDSWYEGPVAKGMVELILDQEEPMGYAQWEHKSTPTYANERVCIVGDAAHATTPWGGAGAGMAIEDAYLLGHIFGSLTTAEEINGAFTIFDELRRPRCQQIVDDGRRTGLLFCGQDKAAGVNAKKLGEALVPLFGHLGDINFESLKQKALKMLYDKKS